MNLQPCQAHSKQTGLPCKQPVVPGYTVCHWHGANKKNHGGHPPVSGKYSKSLKNAKLQSLYEQYQADPELTDLFHEIALIRAVMAQRLEQDTSTDGPPPPDFDARISALTEQIGKLIERKHKIDHGEQYVITIPVLMAMAARISDIINTHVSDATVRAAISVDLAKVLGEAKPA